MSLDTKTAKELTTSRKQRLVTIEPDALAKEALAKMNERGIHHLVVLKHGKLAGLIGAHELLRATSADHWLGAGRSVRVSEIMRTGVPTVDETTDIATAMKLMIEKGLTALPIVHDGQVTDIVTETDLLQLMHRISLPRDRKNEALVESESALASPFLQKLLHSLGAFGI